MINVYLYGKFRGKVPGSTVESECMLEMETAEGETILSVMERLGITPDDVAHIFLNYQYSTSNRKVHSGDRLAIFPIEMSVLYRQYFVKFDD
ncbi:MAG: MoaD/ThiS family protein [Eubacteriales bacterium]